MLRRRVMTVARQVLVATALAGSVGCSVFVQNRYSVFGFDALQTESAAEARTWSLGLLGSVAVLAASFGAAVVWWVQRRRRRGSLAEPPLSCEAQRWGAGVEEPREAAPSAP